MFSDEQRQTEVDIVQALHSKRFPSWVNEETVIDIVDPATKGRVEVPLMKTENTNGLLTYFINRENPKRRESYLCMLYQKQRCKSHARCNQIHAERDFIKEKRAGQVDEKGIEPYQDQRSFEVIVTDPSNPNSKVVIPFMKTLPSKGREEYVKAQREAVLSMENDGGATSNQGANIPNKLKDMIMKSYRLCPGLQGGSACCVPEGPEACPNIQAQMDFLQFLRRPRPCCMLHGDNVPPLKFRGRIFMSNRFSQRCALESERVTETRGLRELVAPNSQLLVFNANRACRMFLEGKCPFGDKCGNLHICREFYAFYVNAPNPSLVALHPPTMSGAPGCFRPGQPAFSRHEAHPSHQTQPHAGPQGKRRGGQHHPGPAAAVVNNMAAMGLSSAGPTMADAAALGASGGMMYPPVVFPTAMEGGDTGHEAFGIPLITEEGPVPSELLPTQHAYHIQLQLARIMQMQQMQAAAMPMPMWYPDPQAQFLFGGPAAMVTGKLDGVGDMPPNPVDMTINTTTALTNSEDEDQQPPSTPIVNTHLAFTGGNDDTDSSPQSPASPLDASARAWTGGQQKGVGQEGDSQSKNPSQYPDSFAEQYV